MARIVKETLRYLAVSGFALVADLAILDTLVRYFSWSYVAAACASFSFGILVTYILSVRFVFEYRRSMSGRIEFASFAAIGGVGLIINAIVIFLAVRILGMHYLLAKCAAAVFTFSFNFIVRRNVLFVERQAA